ncbi:hypothetical protein Tco_1515791 [Tanacetum coccineum]
MLLMEAKEKGTVLDAEAEAFLADVEYEGPHAAAAFMANLSSTSGTNDAPGRTPRLHVESDIDDNTIPYHQYQLDSEVQDVPTEVSSAPPGEISMITILDDLRTQLDGHLKVNQEQSLVNDSLRAELARCKQEMVSLERNKVKHDLDQTIIQRNKRNAELEEENVLLKSKLSQNVESINSLKNESKKEGLFLKKSEDALVQAKVSRAKMSERLGIIKPINYAELNALYSHFVPHKELSREQNKSYLFMKMLNNLFKNIVTEVTEYMRIFDELDTEYERCVLANKNLKIERKNLLIQNDCLIANCLEKDICSIVLASDIVVPPSSNCLCEELRSNCDREHSKVVELEAEILKKQQMLNESEKRCAFIEKNHVNLQVKFQKYKECLQNQRVCDNSNSTASNAIFEINKLKDQLQGKDDTIRNLQTQINITRMLNVGSIIIHALTAENAKLKTELSGKKSSGSTASEKPKVLASGMYTNSSKYVPPPKRANWVKPTPLPKKKQVTFQEPPRTSNRPTQKLPMQQNKNLKFSVNLGEQQITIVNVECDDHNQFVIRSLKSVNTKTPQAKHSVNHTKKVWKATRNHNVNTTKTAWRPTGKVVGSVKPQWKPTGRHFALYDNCPLTRIMEPIVEPLELTPSVSSSSKVTMISRFTDCKLSDRKAGSKGISGIFEC